MNYFNIQVQAIVNTKHAASWISISKKLIATGFLFRYSSCMVLFINRSIRVQNMVYLNMIKYTRSPYDPLRATND